MADVIKSGILLKYSDNAFNSKWKNNYIELCRDSTFRWYEKKGDYTPKRTIFLKNVSAFLAFGEIVKQLPFKPDLKPEQVSLVIAIPHENNRNTRLSFFLCNNEPEIQEWVNTILNTVTDRTSNIPPAPVSSGPNYVEQSHVNPVASGPSYTGSPPAYYPGTSGGPPGGAPPIGFNIGMAPNQYPQGNPPPVSYPQAYPTQGPYQPVGQQAYPYSGFPQNPPMGVPHTNYQPGQVQNANYPRQTGYAPGVPQPYMAGNPVGPAPVYNAIQPGQASYVIVDGKKKKKHSKIKNAAIGVAAGAATAYAASKIFGGHHGGHWGGGHGYGGHGWGGHGWGGHGWGDHGWGGGHYGGSWSSLSSGSWSD